MKRPSAKQIAAFLTGPWMILPQAFVVAGLVGGMLYEPPEIHRNLEKHIFLQGNTDWGGGCLFAGTIALYVAFGFTAAWHLVLALQEGETPSTFRRTLGRSLWILRFHIPVFIIGGIGDIGYDTRVMPNDFRNMFLFAALLYCLSILLIAALNSSRLSLCARLAIAPLFTVLWLIAGSDGNTARAGQLVQAGQDPQPIVRGVRHGIMVTWHKICDGSLGDVGEHASGSLVAFDCLGQAAGLAILLLVLMAIGRSLTGRAIISRRAYWITVCSFAAGVILLTTSIRYAAFRSDRNLVLPALTRVTADISPETIELIRNDPAMKTRQIDLIKGNQLTASVVLEIDRIFKPEYFKAGLTVRLLIPLGDSQFFFLWQNPSFRYADVRTIASQYTQIIDYREIKLMLDLKRDFTTPFFTPGEQGLWGMLLNSPEVLAGHVFLNPSGQVTGLIIVNRR